MGVPKNDQEDPERPIKPTVTYWGLISRLNIPPLGSLSKTEEGCPQKASTAPLSHFWRFSLKRKRVSYCLSVSLCLIIRPLFLISAIGGSLLTMDV